MNNSSNKLLRGDSAYNGGDSYSFIRYGVVKAIESDNGAKDTGLGRIKVYIKGPVSSGGDGDKPDESLDNNAINELPWCFPMLPKHLSIQPKIGEVVWIFTLGKNHQHADRLYIGPIISQPQLLAKDPFQYSALAEKLWLILYTLFRNQMNYCLELVNLKSAPRTTTIHFPSHLMGKTLVTSK